jgi:hypothetical protein
MPKSIKGGDQFYRCIIKHFAVEADITMMTMEDTVTKLKKAGYDVCLSAKTPFRIDFLYKTENVFHYIQLMPAIAHGGKTAIVHNKSQPPWHKSNWCVIRFITLTEGPMMWDALKIKNVTDVLCRSLVIFEDTIENEGRCYDPKIDSDLTHNVYCEYDFKAALARWTLPNESYPLDDDERQFTCHKCQAKKPADAFIWDVNEYTQRFTTMEQVLSKYEYRVAPCCDRCMEKTTLCLKPQPPNRMGLTIYVTDIYKNVCAVKCPTCHCTNTHTLGMEKAYVCDRFNSFKYCTHQCGTRYALLPSYDINIHDTHIPTYALSIQDSETEQLPFVQEKKKKRRLGVRQ